MGFKDLITKTNGRWSRTQITILVQTVLALVLIVSEVIWGGILTWLILAAQGGLFVFVIVAAMRTKLIEFKLGAAHLKVSCDPPAEEQDDILGEDEIPDDERKEKQ